MADALDCELAGGGGAGNVLKDKTPISVIPRRTVGTQMVIEGGDEDAAQQGQGHGAGVVLQREEEVEQQLLLQPNIKAAHQKMKTDMSATAANPNHHFNAFDAEHLSKLPDQNMLDVGVKDRNNDATLIFKTTTSSSEQRDQIDLTSFPNIGELKLSELDELDPQFSPSSHASLFSSKSENNQKSPYTAAVIRNSLKPEFFVENNVLEKEITDDVLEEALEELSDEEERVRIKLGHQPSVSRLGSILASKLSAGGSVKSSSVAGSNEDPMETTSHNDNVSPMSSKLFVKNMMEVEGEEDEQEVSHAGFNINAGRSAMKNTKMPTSTPNTSATMLSNYANSTGLAAPDSMLGGAKLFPEGTDVGVRTDLDSAKENALSGLLNKKPSSGSSTLKSDLLNSIEPLNFEKKGMLSQSPPASDKMDVEKLSQSSCSIEDGINKSNVVSPAESIKPPAKKQKFVGEQLDQTNDESLPVLHSEDVLSSALLQNPKKTSPISNPTFITASGKQPDVKTTPFKPVSSPVLSKKSADAVANKDTSSASSSVLVAVAHNEMKGEQDLAAETAHQPVLTVVVESKTDAALKQKQWSQASDELELQDDEHTKSKTTSSCGHVAAPASASTVVTASTIFNDQLLTNGFFKPGQIVEVFGESGSGKTSFLAQLAVSFVVAVRLSPPGMPSPAPRKQVLGVNGSSSPAPIIEKNVGSAASTSGPAAQHQTNGMMNNNNLSQVFVLESSSSNGAFLKRVSLSGNHLLKYINYTEVKDANNATGSGAAGAGNVVTILQSLLQVVKPVEVGHAGKEVHQPHQLLILENFMDLVSKQKQNVQQVFSLLQKLADEGKLTVVLSNQVRNKFSSSSNTSYTAGATTSSVAASTMSSFNQHDTNVTLDSVGGQQVASRVHTRLQLRKVEGSVGQHVFPSTTMNQFGASTTSAGSFSATTFRKMELVKDTLSCSGGEGGRPAAENEKFASAAAAEKKVFLDLRITNQGVTFSQ
ncbi:unnamed protein product [Amoebophrya sp. A120]|nr:unnamed protein product [Amoebophrya sp. A120]|eukprot:GSA120T00014302001.1